MRIGQPVYWQIGNDAMAGIVKDVLPLKAGVVVYVRAASGKIETMVVKQPHKITEADVLKKVIAAYEELPEVQKWMEEKAGSFYKPTAPVAPQPKAEPKTESECTLAFTKAMADIENLSVADKLALNGMGFDVQGLPEIKEDPEYNETTEIPD